MLIRRLILGLGVSGFLALLGCQGEPYRPTAIEQPIVAVADSFIVAVINDSAMQIQSLSYDAGAQRDVEWMREHNPDVIGTPVSRRGLSFVSIEGDSAWVGYDIPIGFRREHLQVILMKSDGAWKVFKIGMPERI